MARVAFLVDIGHHAWHVGDDAIARATYQQLRRLGHDPVVCTRNRERASRLFPDEEYIELPALAHPVLEREDQVHRIARMLREHKLPHSADEKAWAECMRECRDLDAIIIGGGGSYNSVYVWLAQERFLMSVIAEVLGIPCLMSGQSVGPTILGHDRELFESLLHNEVRGIRGPVSASCAHTITETEHVIIPDDALHLLSASSRGNHHIIASFSPISGGMGYDEAAHVYARLLDEAARQFQVPVVLVPHMADPQKNDGDCAFHRVIAEHMTAHVTCSDIASPRETVRQYDGAVAAIGSRFHHGVFALGMGIPTLLISPDMYSQHRNDDLLKNYCLDTAWAIPLASLARMYPSRLIAEFGERLHEYARHIDRMNPLLHARQQEWWKICDRVIAREAPEIPRELYREISGAGYGAPPIATQLRAAGQKDVEFVEHTTQNDLYLARCWQRLEVVDSDIAQRDHVIHDLYARIEQVEDEALRLRADAEQWNRYKDRFFVKIARKLNRFSRVIHTK